MFSFFLSLWVLYIIGDTTYQNQINHSMNLKDHHHQDLDQDQTIAKKETFYCYITMKMTKKIKKKKKKEREKQIKTKKERKKERQNITHLPRILFVG